jgi:hypothetical protein
MPGEAPTLAKNAAGTVGANLERWRKAQPDLRQEDIAATARNFGLKWAHSSVAQLEHGDRGLSADELLLLPLILDDASNGQGLELTELLAPPRGDVVEPAEGTRLTSTAVRKILAGKMLDLRAGDFTTAEYDQYGKLLKVWPDMAQGLKNYLRRYWPEAYRGAKEGDLRRTLNEIVNSMGLADEHLGEQLNVDTFVVAIVAHRLWGHSLTEERDLRVQGEVPPGADRRTTQALRGHVTRRLKEELRETIEETG